MAFSPSHLQFNRSKQPLAAMLLLLLLLLLAACGSSDPVMPQDGEDESTSQPLAELISSANDSRGNTRTQLTLRAANLLLRREPSDLESNNLEEFPVASIQDPALRAEVTAIVAQALNDNEQADSALDFLAAADQTNFTAQQAQTMERLIGDAYYTLGDELSALDAYFNASELAPLNQELSNRIWSSIDRLEDGDIQDLADSTASYQLRGWVELARIYRGNQTRLQSQLDGIEQWQRIWAQHSAVNLLPTALLDLNSAWDQRPRQITLLLPIQQAAGLAIQEGFLSAYYEALDESGDVPQVSVIDTSNAVDINPLYSRAVESGAELIIGPLDKEFVNRLHREPELAVPTLALNYADDASPGPANLFQFGLAPDDEINQAANIAWQLGYRNAALLTPESADYERLQQLFSESWTERGGQIVSHTNFVGDGDYADVVKRLLAIDSSESRAERVLQLLPRNTMEFTPRRRSDVDFIFLMANPRQGRQIKPTLAFYFAQDVPVFALPSINDGLQNQSANRDLDGIIFTDAPWLLDSANASRNLVDANLRSAQGPLQRLRALGIDSFRLHARLTQFADGSLEHIEGATGELSVDETHRIYRQLQPAVFENGTAQPLALDITTAGGGAP